MFFETVLGFALATHQAAHKAALYQAAVNFQKTVERIQRDMPDLLQRIEDTKRRLG
jgi:hypothetical protein